MTLPNGLPEDAYEGMAMSMRVWAHEFRRKWGKDSDLSKDCDRAATLIMEMRSKLTLAEQEKREAQVLAHAWAVRAVEAGEENKKLKGWVK